MPRIVLICTLVLTSYIEVASDQALCKAGQSQRNTEFRNQTDDIFAHYPFGDFSCPDATWLQTVAQSSSQCSVPDAHVLVIGGNKGYDCIGWLRFFSTAEQRGRWLPSAKQWHEEKKAHMNGHKLPPSIYMCGVCRQCLDEYPVPAHPLSERPPTVTCVEPLPTNFAKLNETAGKEPWMSSGLQVKQLAAVLGTANLPTAAFPTKAPYGEEGIGVFTKRRGQGPQATVQVKTATVDDIAFRSQQGVPTVLTIDAEGLDALILLGAARILASGLVAYIEFEYHNSPPWDSILLEWIIGYLDNMSYDCYFAGHNGKAYKVTGCWQKNFEFHRWSNLVCASRLARVPHTCWHDALEAASMPVG